MAVYLEDMQLLTPDDLPIADSTHLGMLRPDNTTITINNGVLTAMGGGVIITEEPDPAGGTVKIITTDGSIDLSQDTVDAAHLLSGYTAHNSAGQQVLGTYIAPPTPTYQSKTATPTTSQQTITPDSGYDGLSSVTVNAMPNMTLPTSVSNTSSGTRKAQIMAGTSAKYINIPTGYNSSNAYYEIAALWLDSATFNKNGTYNYDGDGNGWNQITVNVSGGGGMNAQTAQSTTRATSSTYTQVISLTCETAGTYDVYWTTFRSSTSGTWGSQLYLGNTAYGTADTGNWSNHVQNKHLTGVSISANQTVSVRVRTRGSNYYGYVGTLTIIQTA